PVVRRTNGAVGEGSTKSPRHPVFCCEGVAMYRLRFVGLTMLAMLSACAPAPAAAPTAAPAPPTTAPAAKPTTPPAAAPTTAPAPAAASSPVAAPAPTAATKPSAVAAAAPGGTVSGKCGMGNGQKAAGEPIKLGAIVTKQPGT